MSPTFVQIDWVSSHTSLPIVSVGSRVITNYNTGPYLITGIDGPCECALEEGTSKSEPHYHITCNSDNGLRAWLNGYRLNGKSVCCEDEILRITERAG